MRNERYLYFYAFIFFRLKSHQGSLTFSKAKMTKTKVILIEVTTWTQAVGRARNLKSKTIEIGCSNKKMFHSEGKSEKSYWAMKCNKYQTLVYVCVYCYICQTNFQTFFVNVNFKPTWCLSREDLLKRYKNLNLSPKSVDLNLCNNMNTQRLTHKL